MEESTLLIVTTTFESKKHAEAFSKTLIEKDLAACTQISGPITSIYKWDGKVNQEEEWICHIKTPENKWVNILEFFEKNHPYDVPEIIGIPTQNVSESYLKWVNNS